MKWEGMIEPIKRDKEIDKEWKTESYMQIESERAGRWLEKKIEIKQIRQLNGISLWLKWRVEIGILLNLNYDVSKW